MRRVEKLAAHLRTALRDCRVVIGSLGDTKLPAVMVNQLNQPYDASGMIVLDAEEPKELLVQLDGWLEGETFKTAKPAAHQFKDALTAAVQSFKAKTKIIRTNVRSVNRTDERWRISLDVVIT